MAKLQTLFASAPRIKLYIDQQLVAYAIGFNFNVSVDIQPVYVLGKFAPVSLEPTMYNTVTGTIQIVRLRSSSQVAAAQAQAGPTGGAAIFKGPIAKSLKDEQIAALDDDEITNSPIKQSSLFRHITPSQLLLASAFDMAMFMKVPNADIKEVLKQDAIGNTPAVAAVKAVTGNKTIEEVAWMAIQSCRITSRNTNISMGQLVNEPLNFQGLLATHSFDDATNNFKSDSAIKNK